MPKPLEEELAKTRRAISAIPARRPDDLEDYFHDAIVKALIQGKALEQWLGYLYKSVSRRVACGQEGRVYLPLDEALTPDDKPVLIHARLDVEKALQSLSPRRLAYIYEYFYEGRTLKEIAERYHVTVQAVNKTLHKGLLTLKSVLE